MDLLLDTHAFIWFLNGDSQLPVAIKNLIADTLCRKLNPYLGKSRETPSGRAVLVNLLTGNHSSPPCQ